MRLFILSLASFFLCCLCNNAAAQSESISVSVSSASVGIDAATVSLLRASDSSWVLSGITDSKGTVTLHDVAIGKYTIAATAIGYKAKQIPVNVSDAGASVNIELDKESSTLKEVNITGKKPFIEMTPGKTTVNIEGTTTVAGANVLDLLRRLPGVSVDQNGNISLMSKSGVLVLIDDRPTYLSGEELADYLRTITADGVAQIELMTQPDAKYDAAGSAGVINIKLKKSRANGWNGNLSLTYGQGVYFNRHEDFMVSYKKDRLSLSVTGSDMEAKGFADWNEHLYYLDPATGSVTAHSVLRSSPVERFSNTALRLAADYKLSSKTTIGASVRGSYHPNTMPTNLTSVDSGVVGSGITYGNKVMKDFSIRKDIAANAYLSHQFSKSCNMDINVDYLVFGKLANQDYAQTEVDASGQPASDVLMLSGHQPQQVNVYSIRADYSCTLGKGIKLDAGVKSSYVSTDAQFIQYAGGSWINDTALTNHFIYNENINAAYVTASKNFGSRWEMKVGFRAEQTIAEGTQYVHYTHFTKNYVSPFPTAYIAYKMDSVNRFELNYSRRIDRPHYTQLNPFVYYSFQNTYETGNPNLQPQYTNTLELSHSYKNMLITKITYSATRDVVTDLLEVHDSDKLVYGILRNLSSNDYIAGSLTFNKDLWKWFSVNTTATIFSAEYSGIVNNTGKTVHWGGYSFDANGQFSFAKGWKAEFYVNYFSAGRRDINEYFDGHAYMEFGASKKASEKLMLRFSASDPFWLDKIHMHNGNGSFAESSAYSYASRLFSLSVTCKFGQKPHENRRNEIEEVKRL